MRTTLLSFSLPFWSFFLSLFLMSNLRLLIEILVAFRFGICIVEAELGPKSEGQLSPPYEVKVGQSAVPMSDSTRRVGDPVVPKS